MGGRSDNGDSAPGAARAWALSALARHSLPGGVSSVELMECVCHAISSGLDAVGAAIELGAGQELRAVVAASDEAALRCADLEFDLGEGPATEAYVENRPVSVPDTHGPDADRWAGWGAAVQEADVGATFAFPLHVGAARFGVLTVYCRRPRVLSRVEFARCVAMSEVATEVMLALSDAGADGLLDPALEGVLGFRQEVYQAQGMVMAALGTSLAEALARMRAHAFASGRSLDEIALDIVTGGLRLTDDRF